MSGRQVETWFCFLCSGFLLLGQPSIDRISAEQDMLADPAARLQPTGSPKMSEHLLRRADTSTVV